MNIINATNFIDGEVIDAKVVAYVERFNKSMKQTAESIIDMGNTIYEASRYLGPVPLEQFCKEIHMGSNNPMFKKLKKIGENHARLEANVTKLPNTWTTVYKLAAMSPEEFTKIIEANVLTPFVTAKEINECLGTTKVRSADGTSKANSITISVSAGNVANAALLVAKIEELKQKFNFELDVAKELNDEIFVYKQGQGV
jgi:hypothetical protein